MVAPGAQWDLLARHHAVTTVSLLAEHDSGAPPPSSTIDDLQYGVTVTPQGATGWTGTPNSLREFIVLARSGPGAPWRISAINTSG